MEHIYKCPECESENILVYSETSYNINTGEFYCHSIKTYDDIAKVRCIECDWEGKRYMLEDIEE